MAKKAPNIDTTVTKKPKVTKTPKVDKNYSLIRAIRQEKNYKNNIERRDRNVRKYLAEECNVVGIGKIVPGQLMSFNYFEPKTKEELEYYDAMPVTIFFGIFNTENGKRVMGFNIHYYPPRIRYQVMDRIMEIWKPMYQKVWEDGLSKELMHFDYKWLQMQLEKAGLGFGVRMYIPSLMAETRLVPPKDWSKAVFTEGVFKKRTRNAILNYWRNYRKKH